MGGVAAASTGSLLLSQFLNFGIVSLMHLLVDASATFFSMVCPGLEIALVDVRSSRAVFVEPTRIEVLPGDAQSSGCWIWRRRWKLTVGVLAVTEGVIFVLMGSCIPFNVLGDVERFIKRVWVHRGANALHPCQIPTTFL